MKKWIGILAGLLFFSLLPFPVHAEEVEEPVEDEAYTFALDVSHGQESEENNVTRAVDSVNLRVSASGICGSTVFGWDSKYNCMLKYVASDGDNVDMENKWRMVYCLEYLKPYPTGMLVWNQQPELNKKITYCLFYGCRYWGQTSVWAAYSCGDWKKDYWITQWAIHILNGEVTLNEIAANTVHDPTFAKAMEVLQKLVNDANKDSNYTGFTGNYYTGVQFGQDRTTVTWSATKDYNGKAGYMTEWITPQLSDGYSNTIREYARSLSVSSNVEGISVIKENSRTFAPYRLWMSEETYKELQKTGKDIVTTATAIVPKKFGSWLYNATNTGSQNCTVLEVSTGSIYMDTKLAVVTSSIPQLANPGVTIAKVDAADESVYVAGAKLSLSDLQGNVLCEFVTTTEPYTVENVAAGDYIISEVTAPPGYGKADPLQIKVTTGTEAVTYKVKDLKYCDLTVVKRIPVTDNVDGNAVANITWAHGNPTFLFKVEGKDLYGQEHVYKHAVVFTQDYVEAHTENGFTELSYTFTCIPQGNAYRVSEEAVARYKLEGIDTTDTNVKMEESAAVVDLLARPTGTTVRFSNTKYRWDKFSHNDVVVNKIPL